MAPIIIDGGTATELERAGVPVEAPLWSAAALLAEEPRRVLRSIHASFLGAGAHVVTANTFRCNARAAQAAGLDRAGAAWLVHAAIGVATAARMDAGTPAAIAGSMAPIEDCYRPDLVPPEDQLRAEHGWLARELVRSGVDLVLIETMNSRREASIALEAALAAGGRAWVSFVCGADARLLSGEPLAQTAGALAAEGAEVVLVNCSGLAETEACLRELRDAYDARIGGYPNLEDRSGPDLRRPLPVAVSPEDFADTLERWHEELDLAVVGGCCGATPAHVAALAARLSPGDPLSRRPAAARS
jgi:S-methylmethionine-dependent homocysteine/selenocysteine methylase